MDTAATKPAPGQPAQFEVGVFSFGDMGIDPATGRSIGAGRTTRNVLEQIDLADQVGLDIFGIGEHHRRDFVISAPAIVLAAAAGRTDRIRLTSAVTVLSSDDPVRVFQQYSTLDLLSSGRAEIMVGRGSFIESFPLFGYSLDDYDDLFAEKLELLLELRRSNPISWMGHMRAPLNGVEVHPRPDQDPLPVWLAVGGNPPSVVRAARLGLPLAVAIIGGPWDRFAPLAKMYRDSFRDLNGHRPTPAISINSPSYVADTGDRARAEYMNHFAAVMARIGRERGWPPASKSQVEAQMSPEGAVVIGSPEQVAEKIVHQHHVFGHRRFLAQIGIGTLPHAQAMRAIELLGTEVAPAVREAIGPLNGQG